MHERTPCQEDIAILQSSPVLNIVGIPLSPLRQVAAPIRHITTPQTDAIF